LHLATFWHRPGEQPGDLAARARARAAESGPTRARAWDDPVVSWEAWNTPNSLNVAHADNNIFRLAQRGLLARGLAAASAGDEARWRRAPNAVALDIAGGRQARPGTVAGAPARRGHERQRQLAERFAKAAEGRYATARATWLAPGGWS
jgi:hypothetical protein